MSNMIPSRGTAENGNPESLQERIRGVGVPKWRNVNWLLVEDVSNPYGDLYARPWARVVTVLIIIAGVVIPLWPGK